MQNRTAASSREIDIKLVLKELRKIKENRI